MYPDHADRLQDAEYRRCVRQAKCQHLFGQSVRYTFGELELRPQHCGHRRSVLYPGIEKGFGSYRDKLEYQARQMERTFSLPLEFRKPTSGLRFTQTGLELIRNPADLEDSSQIDDQITREPLGALEQPPGLKFVGSGVPNIQPVADRA